MTRRERRDSLLSGASENNALISCFSHHSLPLCSLSLSLSSFESLIDSLARFSFPLDTKERPRERGLSLEQHGAHVDNVPPPLDYNGRQCMCADNQIVCPLHPTAAAGEITKFLFDLLSLVVGRIRNNDAGRVGPTRVARPEIGI